MNKPEPKHEIVIKQNSGIFIITVESADAAQWIENEARQFGSLFPQNGGLDNFHLLVRATYDYDEVAAYLARDGIVIKNSPKTSDSKDEVQS